MPLSLPPSYSAIAQSRASLSNDARQVLHDAYAQAHVAAAAHSPNAPAPQEPDYVAELVRTGVPALAAAWRPHFAGWGLQLSIFGVFIHQSPTVRFQMPGNPSAQCELGDLLIASQFPGMPSKPGTAFLAQVKRAKASVTSMARTAPKQHFLYDRWPDFDLLHSLHTGVAIGTQADQGKLAELSNNGPTAHGILPTLPTWRMKDFNLQGNTAALEVDLADVAAGVCGRPYAKFSGTRTAPTMGGHPPNLEWSFLINHLIDYTALRAYTRTRIGAKGVRRGIMVSALSGSRVARWEDEGFSLGPSFAKVMQPLEDRLDAYAIGRAVEEFGLLEGAGEQPPPTDEEGPAESSKGFGIILMTIR